MRNYELKDVKGRVAQLQDAKVATMKRCQKETHTPAGKLLPKPLQSSLKTARPQSPHTPPVSPEDMYIQTPYYNNTAVNPAMCTSYYSYSCGSQKVSWYKDDTVMVEGNSAW